jgi:hypothetical protein
VRGLCGPAVAGRLAPCSAARRRAPMPAHRLSTSSSKSAGRGGDILGRFGDRALLVAERTTQRMQALAGRDSDTLVWWGSEVECVLALPASNALPRSM